jgi:hypothetical protein
MRIVVCRPQMPFERSRDELTASLVAALRRHGHQAELVTLPTSGRSDERLELQAFPWRLLDLDEVDGRAIDVVITTTFPSYVVRHHNKRVWLVEPCLTQQLDRTDRASSGESAEDRALRRSVHRLERGAFAEATRLFAASRGIATGLEESTGLAAEVLPCPAPELADVEPVEGVTWDQAIARLLA